MNFNLSKTLAFTCALLAVSFMGRAELFNADSDLQELSLLEGQAIEQNYMRQIHSRRHDNEKKSRKCKDLTLEDFDGEYVLQADSRGGLGAAVTPVTAPTIPTFTVGHAATFDGQVSIDTEGNITFNFISGAIYGGEPGKFVFPNSSSISATGKIIITDAKFGFGSIIITITSTGSQTQLDFVTIRDKKTCKVIRIEGHETSATTSQTNVLAYTFEKSFQ